MVSLRVSLLALAVIFATWLPRSGAAAQQPEIPKKIDEKIAQRLAAEAYGSGKLDPSYFDYNEDPHDIFLTFEGLGEQSAFGFFSVNPWTGDVWALWGCHRLSTLALRKSQTEIRKRFTSTEMKQYARLSRLKPDCIVED